MVTEQVGERSARADGETRSAREIIFRDRRPLFLVVLTHVVRGHTADNTLDLLAIAIIDKTRGRRGRHRDEAILGIVEQDECAKLDVLD